MTRVTMKDIAAILGISTNTVSRAFSGKADINEETKKRIFQKARELGYRREPLDPHAHRRQSHIIGVVISDITNPFFSRVVRGIEDVLILKGYSILLCNTDESYDRERSSVDMLLKRNVDGIIMTPTQDSHKDIDALLEMGIPVVLLGRYFQDVAAWSVVGDDTSGGHAAIDHLVKLGHRRILFLNASPYISSAKERMIGYENALRENGLEVIPELIRECDPKPESAYNLMRSILLEKLEYTAIFTFSDLMMLGVLRCLKQQNIRVPEDVSLVGFDDIEYAGMLDPPLTTVRQPQYRLGSESARMLLDQLDRRTESRRILLPLDIVIRDSTARLE